MAEKDKDEGKQRAKDQHAGEEGDTFVAPDRPDQNTEQEGDPTGEVEIVVEDFSPPGEVDLGADAEADAAKAREAKEEREDKASTERAQREVRTQRRDDEEESEQEQYSRRVQKRINREIALRKRTEGKLEEVVAANRALEARLGKIERSQAAVQITAEAQAKIARLRSEIADITTKLEAALEAGDTKETLKLQIALGDKQGDLKLAERDVEEAKRTATAAATREEPADRKTGDEMPQTAARWIAANRRWWNLAKFKGQRDDAVEMDRQILADIQSGELDFEEYSDEHLDELARRLHAEYPDLDIRDGEGEPIEFGADDDDNEHDERPPVKTNGKQRGANGREVDVGARPRGSARAPMGGMGGRDGRRNAQNPYQQAMQGKVTLNADDFQQMRKFGLDPNNKEHKQRFAKERMRTIIKEHRDGGAG